MRQPETSCDICVAVNGVPHTLSVPVRTSLADVLRDRLGLTGTHVGCEEGQCGACTVLVDGRPVRSCLMLAVQTDGASVQTIEGLDQGGEIAVLQEAFYTRSALQCGFCTSGMLIAAHTLLAANRDLTRDEIREGLNGHICRCTGYHTIIDAIEEIACQRRELSDV